MKRFILTALGITLLCALVGCFPKHIDPPLLTYDTDTLALLSAQARAKDIGGLVYHISTKTHSMFPAIQGNDYIVVDLRVAFKDVKIGMPISYIAEWQPHGPAVTHRAVDRDSGGILAEGDDVDAEHPENHWRVTENRYIGVVDGIYRVKR